MIPKRPKTELEIEINNVAADLLRVNTELKNKVFLSAPNLLMLRRRRLRLSRQYKRLSKLLKAVVKKKII